MEMRSSLHIKSPETLGAYWICFQNNIVLLDKNRTASD